MGVSQIDQSDEWGEFTASTEWVKHNDEKGVYRVGYDPAIDETSLAVVSAVATVSGTDPLELDPLYDAVNPPSLDELFDPSKREEQSRDCRMTFRFCEFGITVDGSGMIELRRE